MVTRAILREQIRRILSGGNPSDRDRVQNNEIDLAISDVANQLLKAEVLNTSAMEGVQNVDALAVVTYENIEVKRGVNWGENVKTAMVNLPITPMMLPNGGGVQSIYPSGRPYLEYRYIPISMFNFWQNNRYVSPLHKRLYTYTGNTITIYDDLFSSGDGATVDVRIAVADLSKVGENDPLPILPEHRDLIVGAVVTRFIGEPDTNRRETDQLSPSKRN